MRVQMERIDRCFDDDDGPIYLNTMTKPMMRRYLVIACLLYMGLFVTTSWLGICDTQQAIPPYGPEARVVCTTTVLQTEAGIRAAKLVYANNNEIDVNLYATSITRTVTCIDINGESHTLQYKDDYLNISTVDVDHIYATLMKHYPIGESFTAWYYANHCHVMPQELDRNCLSTIAIDPDIHYNYNLYTSLVVLHHGTVFVSVVLVIWLHFIIRSEPRLLAWFRVCCCTPKKSSTF